MREAANITREDLHCANCSEKILGKPVRQGGDIFCSLECANMAAGIDPEENDGYFEEDSLEDFYAEEEE